MQESRIVLGPHRAAITARAVSAVGRIRIAAPYVTETSLLSFKRASVFQLLTKLDVGDVVAGASSLDALHTFVRSGAEVRQVPPEQPFHAKVYLFDEKSGIVTSANLTHFAFDRNIEAGVVLGRDSIAELISWFDELWSRSFRVTESELESLMLQTAALRAEVRRVKAKEHQLARVRLGGVDVLDRGSRVEYIDAGVQFFLANTNRGRESGSLVSQRHHEEGMFRGRCVAAWEKFKSLSHMKRARPGDLIFVYANGVGVKALARATSSAQRIEIDDGRRIDPRPEETEWQVPVEWLTPVDEARGAFAWDPPPIGVTFVDVGSEKYRGRRDAALDHFLAERVPGQG